MRIALLQLNPTVGDLAGNIDLILNAARRVPDVDLAVTSELALLGYPPSDLLLNEDFVERCWQALSQMAEELAELPSILVGLAEHNPSPEGRTLFNSAALLSEGKVMGSFHKTLLSAYDLFYEDRYFEPAKEAQVLQIKDKLLGISIGEDIWNSVEGGNRRPYHTDPMAELMAKDAQVIVNLSASPFTAGKQLHRQKKLSGLARKYSVPILYVNQVGGNDDLVFDGRSCFFDATGRLAARAQGFGEDILVADLDRPEECIAQDDFTPEAEVWRALVLGTGDYVHKCGFSSVLLGLSGGIDSALVAAIAASALGPKNVLGVVMPSPYTSQTSIDDAADLAKNLGMETITIPITDIMNSYDRELAEHFVGLPKDVTEENIQARIRSSLLMALSNKYGSILLATGNKSELSVGYCTIYGDMCGGLSVISDLSKTMVYQLAEWLNSNCNRMVIPESIIKKAPTAELRPGQIDEECLPPYPVLDEILKRYIEEHQDREDLIAAGFDAFWVDRVISMVKNSEFKRRQAAPGLKVTDRTFGRGWKMPVACRSH